jgi:hypothetical protein
MSDFSLSDLAAVTNGGGNNDDGGFGNGNGWWIILLFILLGGRGWGNYGNGGYQGGAGSVGGNQLYPWMEIQTNISNGVASLSNQLCNCCADMQQTVSNGFFNAETAANSRQMADMQQMFGLQSQLADCCCENRLGIANLNSTILSENCADRAALSDGVRDIIQANQSNTQSIIDKLCQLELDGYKRENSQLQAQLNAANLAASQAAQNQLITQGFANEVDALYNRLSNCPVPSMPVYGRTPIFQCQPQNPGCGCGCN